MTFHRRQYPLRACYAMTVNKSHQGNTLSRVGLDLRSDVFCHGQLYVAVSRTTSSKSILCLVQPERLINGVPHVTNCVYDPFIEAATGSPLPHYNPIFYHPPGYPLRGSTQPPANNSLPPNNSEPASNNNQLPASWNIIDEIGDGACLLRTIARRAFGDPQQHPLVRQQIISHIQSNIAHFLMHIENGFGDDTIRIQGSLPRTYHSVEEYLHIMAQPTAYAGYNEIAAAQLLYGFTIEVKVAGTSYAPPPDPPEPDVLNVLFHPHSFHFCTLTPSNLNLTMSSQNNR